MDGYAIILENEFIERIIKPAKNNLQMVTKEARQISPYFELFQGKKVPMSKIREESPQVIDAVKEMIATGRIVGQHAFIFTPNSGLTTDIILWLPEKICEQNT